MNITWMTVNTITISLSHQRGFHTCIMTRVSLSFMLINVTAPAHSYMKYELVRTNVHKYETT